MHYVRLSHPPQLRAQGSPAVIVPTGPSLPLPAVGADKLVYHAIITLVGCPYSLLPSETKAVSDALSSMMYDPWTFSSQQGFKSGVEPTISTTNPTSLCATAADFPVPTAALCSVNCQGWVDAGAGSTVAPETYTAEGAFLMGWGSTLAVGSVAMGVVGPDNSWMRSSMHLLQGSWWCAAPCRGPSDAPVVPAGPS